MARPMAVASQESSLEWISRTAGFSACSGYLASPLRAADYCRISFWDGDPTVRLSFLFGFPMIKAQSFPPFVRGRRQSCGTVAKTLHHRHDRTGFSILRTRLFRVTDSSRLVSSLVLLVVLSSCANDRAAIDANQIQPTPLNASYPLEPRELPVQLVDGRTEVPAAPGSAAVVRTMVWGGPAVSDLTGDGQDDALLILVQDRGGSGTFYYLAVAIREGVGFRGVDSVLLGDRIDPQRIDVNGNRIQVHYLDRESGEAVSVPPSRATERTFLYDSGEERLSVVAHDFAGEADPARMNLSMKTWVWRRTQYNNDTVETPVDPEAFTIKFTEDQRVEITTDCNSMQGGYETEGNRLSFSMLMGTLMHCDSSQEGVFAGDLEKVNGYLFTSRGELALELKYDTGSMIFR